MVARSQPVKSSDNLVTCSSCCSLFFLPRRDDVSGDVSGFECDGCGWHFTVEQFEALAKHQKQRLAALRKPK